MKLNKLTNLNLKDNNAGSQKGLFINNGILQWQFGRVTKLWASGRGGEGGLRTLYCIIYEWALNKKVI